MAYKSSTSLENLMMMRRFYQSEAEFHLEQAKIHLRLAERHERVGTLVLGFYLGAMTMIGLFVFLVMI